MSTIEVVAVVGAAEPERQRYAQRLAEATGRRYLPARRLAIADDPVDEAQALLPWFQGHRVVAEFPMSAEPPEIIAALSDPQAAARLDQLLCVVDARRLDQQLRQDGYLLRRHEGDEETVEYCALALLTVQQLEFAASVVVVHWQQTPTAELSRLLALIAHLAPQARLCLDPEHDERFGLAEGPLASGQPGWVGLLNDEFEPRMTDVSVNAIRYEQLRPLHPERLLEVLDREIEPGRHGRVLRSAGLCRLATRPAVTAQWQQVGSMFSLHPLAEQTEPDPDDEPLALGQELALIGVDLDGPALVAALDRACLSDTEFSAGPEHWRGLPDPFPRWQLAA